MKRLIPLIFISSCTIHPSAYNPATGEFVSLGGSLGTKTTKESAYAQTSNGVIAYGIEGKDETIGVKYYFLEEAIGEIANAVTHSVNSVEGTKRAIGAQGVRRSAINADRAVRLKALEIPAAEVAPVVPPIP